jgi:thermitase
MTTAGWPLTLWAAASLLIMTASGAAAANPSPPRNGERFVEGELLVKFRGGARGPAAQAAQDNFKHEVKRRFDQLGWQCIRFPRGLTREQALAKYRQHPDVLAVEPNYVFHSRLADAGDGFAPNDPRSNEQWALAKIGATNAWGLTTGSTNVVVAVLDSGVRYTHEDLSANMWRNPNEIPGNGIDDDGNGYIDDIYGIDAVSQDSDPVDERISFVHHGTACASIIGAVGNNGLGVAGVNWSVQVMALRLGASSNFIASAWIIECFEYVLAMKNRGVNIRVTSNSYGGDDAPSLAVREAIDAAGNAGVLNVFAAGNSTRDMDVACDYPACFRLPGMINVAASDQADNLATFSNYGATNVDLAAPGVNIIVADGIATNGYNPVFSGTSASAPFVAGAAALMAAAYPFATAAQLKRALLDSVELLPAFTNKMQSHGRLHIGRAMQQSLLSTNAPPVILSSPRSQTVGVDYSATFHAIATGAQPMTYDWQFDGNPLARTLEPTLVVPSVRIQESGDYRVILSNRFGMATSAVAVLTVVTQPTILAQPQGVRLLDGSNTTLAVSAAGAFPLSYQWQHNSQMLAGGTNTCLPLSNVNWTASGDYRVVLSNAHGMRTSGVAQVVVLTRPYPITQPQSHTVAVGANLSLTVTITNTATLPLGGRWLRNGLTAGSMNFNDPFTAVTNFANIQTNAAGRWSALLTNEAPVGLTALFTSNAYLTVVLPPTNQIAAPGSNVTFSALAVGAAPIRYQWQHQGTNLANAIDATLSLTNVRGADAGMYSVVVTNAIGVPAVFSASLQLLGPSQPVLADPRLLAEGRFQIGVQGLSNQQPYAVEISTNLTNWTVLAAFTATNSSFIFTDSPAILPPQRFYRVRWDP